MKMKFRTFAGTGLIIAMVLVTAGCSNIKESATASTESVKMTITEADTTATMDATILQTEITTDKVFTEESDEPETSEDVTRATEKNNITETSGENLIDEDNIRITSENQTQPSVAVSGPTQGTQSTAVSSQSAESMTTTQSATKATEIQTTQQETKKQKETTTPTTAVPTTEAPTKKQKETEQSTTEATTEAPTKKQEETTTAEPSIYDYPFDTDAIKAEMIAWGEAQGLEHWEYDAGDLITPETGSWFSPVVGSERVQGEKLKKYLKRFVEEEPECVRIYGRPDYGSEEYNNFTIYIERNNDGTVSFYFIF